MSTNKFLKGVIIGAIAGGALTLFNKETRTDIIKKSKTCGLKIKDYVTNPGETIERIQDSTMKFKQTVQNINDDLLFIAEKANELKEVGTETIKIIDETKEAFKKEPSNDDMIKS